MPVIKSREPRSTRGDEIRKENVIPTGNPALVNPIKRGIEEQEQVSFLKEAGCDRIQGYVFYKPMPIEDFEKLENIKWIEYNKEND